MKRFYCNGKKGYCDRGNDANVKCFNCEFGNGEGGKEVEIPNTNYDRIRNMSVEELAEGIATLLFAHLNKFNIGIGNPPQTMTEQEKAETKNAWLEWLEIEVTEE